MNRLLTCGPILEPEKGSFFLALVVGSESYESRELVYKYVLMVFSSASENLFKIDIFTITLEGNKANSVKKMKPKIIELNKNHLIYCILMVIFVHSPLYSQIIYTDIPDATPNATYPLDLNNDTIVDFLIQ